MSYAWRRRSTCRRRAGLPAGGLPMAPPRHFVDGHVTEEELLRAFTFAVGIVPVRTQIPSQPWSWLRAHFNHSRQVHCLNFPATLANLRLCPLTHRGRRCEVE